MSFGASFGVRCADLPEVQYATFPKKKKRLINVSLRCEHTLLNNNNQKGRPC